MNDPNLHLFVDDFEIQSCLNLIRVVNRPRKHPEPVLTVDRPWEGCHNQAWGSVVQEPDGLFRMWYFSFPTRQPGELDRGGYCYAESRDGIHWDKPALGVTEFRGSKENNIFYAMSPDGKNLCEEELARNGLGLAAQDEQGNVIGVVNNMDGLTVVRDDDEPDPDKRYKLIANMQDHRMWAPYYRKQYPDVTDEQVTHAREVVFGQYLDTSPDGIHWTRKPRRMVKATCGDYMMVMRDHRNKRWWLNERPTALHGRNVGLRTSKDLMSWPEATETVFFNTPDMGFGRTYEWHGGITPFNYGNMNLGFLEKWCNAGMGDTCELVSGREGQPWQRVAPGVPFLDIGPEDAFDRTLVYPTHNLPYRVGDKLHIYYTGAGPHRQPGRVDMDMAIGLATIGVDRFAGMAHTRGEPGQLLTKPFLVEHDLLEINVEVQFGICGLRVAVRGCDGRDIPGYTLDESRINFDDPGIRKPVCWRDQPNLSGLKGQTVFLLFEIKGAILYGYRFADRKCRSLIIWQNVTVWH